MMMVLQYIQCIVLKADSKRETGMCYAPNRGQGVALQLQVDRHNRVRRPNSVVKVIFLDEKRWWQNFKVDVGVGLLYACHNYK